MSGVILVQGEKNQQASFACRWNTNGSTVTDASASTPWQTIDIFFKETSRSSGFSWPKDLTATRLSVGLSDKDSSEIGAQDFESAAAFGFVLDCLTASNREHETVARLVAPQTSGYIVRSDIIPQRLLGCPLVTSVAGFPKPHQHFDGKPLVLENLQQLPRLLAASAGGLLLKHGDATKTDTQGSLLASLDLELRNRLSFPWLSTKEPKRKTLAIVDGGISSPDNGGTGGSIYLAAQALGIDMVVFDSPNHWVNTNYPHWRKDTVALDCKLEPDDEFPDQIAEAVRSYKGQIDGILTFRDHYKFPVAEAALKLSLPTYAPSAYEIATDKYKTSVSEGHHAFRAASAEEAAAIVQEHKLEFPLIIKPTNGFLSEGVFRVESLAQLEAGTQGINTERHGNEFVIEKYCEGPELDANFVLCDGELLYFEASDDFPKTGDVNGQGAVKSFIELANVLPSGLPASELALLRDSLHKSLLRMGFSNGFYHLEARMENSSMEYVTKNGVLDLAERTTPAKGAPYTWLIEVNPRPPGIQASEAVRHTYGLDYFGLALLFALDDKERVRQLSHPFAQGHQYWCEMVFIPVEKGGVYESGDVCAELFARRPDLAASVSGSFCFLRKGDAVQDPAGGVNSWVAYFNVFSRESREHLLELGEEIRREVKFSIV
ncbi:ATP-grasp domain-containing protein [Trichoderma chlorosporum]